MMKTKLLQALWALLMIGAGWVSPAMGAPVPAIVVFHDFTFVVMESVTVSEDEPVITCVNRGVATTFEVGQKGSEVIAVLVLPRAPEQAVRDMFKGMRHNVPPAAQAILKQHIGRQCLENQCIGVKCEDCLPLKTLLLNALSGG